MRLRLWTSAEPIPAGAPAWIGEQRRLVRATLLGDDPPYPCHFGAIGERGGTNHYSYIDCRQDRAAEIDVLAQAVAAFLARQTTAPKVRMSLLIMVGPPVPALSMTEYRTTFWTILADLSKRDEKPPPAGEPADPADPSWNFHFAGASLFVFGTCPAYRPRRSRALADCLVIGVQSRAVFRTLSGDAGRVAKRRIRRSLAAYEDVPLIADAGDGTTSTVEKWKQYMPDIDGRPASDACPFLRIP